MCWLGGGRMIVVAFVAFVVGYMEMHSLLFLVMIFCVVVGSGSGGGRRMKVALQWLCVA